MTNQKKQEQTTMARTVQREWGRAFTVSIAHVAIDQKYQAERLGWMDEELQEVRERRANVKLVSVEPSQPLPLRMLRGVGSPLIPDAVGIELVLVWSHDDHPGFLPGALITESFLDDDEDKQASELEVPQ